MGLRAYFKSTCRRFIRNLLSDEAVPEPNTTTCSPRRNNNHPRNIEDSNTGLNLTIYRATGGKVVQSFSYDPISDRSYSNLFIVTEKEDLGAELGMIITREFLAR